MNAQEWWKLYYKKAMRAKRENSMSYKYELLCQAGNYRREAALERIIARQQRTIEAQAKRIKLLEHDTTYETIKWIEDQAAK